MSQASDVIKTYIAEHFVNAKLSIRRSDNNDAFLCDIETTDNKSYHLSVYDNALNGSSQDMRDQLERYNPAQVLQDVDGFPVSVTNSGCIVL